MTYMKWSAKQTNFRRWNDNDCTKAFNILFLMAIIYMPSWMQIGFRTEYESEIKSSKLGDREISLEYLLLSVDFLDSWTIDFNYLKTYI